MRRCLLSAMVLGLLLVATGASWAFNLLDYVPAGQDVKFKFINYDVGTIYTAGNGIWTGATTLDGLAQTGPPGGAAGEDSWGIVKLTEIYSDDAPSPFWTSTSSLEEITGIFWGERDTYLADSGSSTAHQQLIHGVGMNVAFFTQMKAALGFTAFDPTGGATAVGSRPSGAPVYPTVTDGALLYTFYSIPGHNWGFPTDEFFTEFYPTPAPYTDSANGGFWADSGSVPYWGVGPGNTQIAQLIADPDGPGPLNGCDATFKFTGVPDPSGKWLVLSDDPIRTRVTPELSSGGLMLIGLVPVGLGWWKRRKA